jgi:hypothetical protein
MRIVRETWILSLEIFKYFRCWYVSDGINVGSFVSDLVNYKGHSELNKIKHGCLILTFVRIKFIRLY